MHTKCSQADDEVRNNFVFFFVVVALFVKIAHLLEVMAVVLSNIEFVCNFESDYFRSIDK